MGSPSTPPSTASSALIDAVRHLQDPAALGALLPLFAHAANNHLTVMLACLDLLAQAGVGDDELRETVRLARTAGQDLRVDLSALHATSRARSRDVVPVEVSVAVDAAMQLVQLAAGGAPEVDVDSVPGLRAVAEPGALEFAVFRMLWLARRRNGRTRPSLDAARVELRERTPTLRGLRVGNYVRVRLQCRDFEIPLAWQRPTSNAGHVVERLVDPDGLEFAAVEAFAMSARGLFIARDDGTASSLELYVPCALT